MEHFRRHLSPGRADELASLVVPVIQTVYDANCARHDPAQFDDNLTFSVQTYRNVWGAVEEALAPIEWLVSDRHHGSFEILAEDKSFHVYKAGATADDLEAARFDRGQTRLQIVERNSAQL